MSEPQRNWKGAKRAEIPRRATAWSAAPRRKPDRSDANVAFGREAERKCDERGNVRRSSTSCSWLRRCR